MSYRQDIKSTSILMLDRNNFSFAAIDFIADKLLGERVKVFRTPDELFYSLFSLEGFVKVAIVSFDVNYLNFIGAISKLIADFPKLRVIVVVFNVTLPVVSLLRGAGVKIILSYYDSHSSFVNALKYKQNNEYISPVVTSQMKIQSDKYYLSYIPLTSTELRILDNILDEVSICNIAKNRGINSKTISAHKLRALQKIAIKNISELFNRQLLSTSQMP